MCLGVSLVRNLPKWNWDGDQIKDVLYDGAEYQQQLDWRRQAAVLHVRDTFRRNYGANQ